MKRTQILVNPDDWQSLTILAKNKKTSVGGLIRYAIRKTFFENERLEKRAHAIDAIFKNRVVTGPINYKELVDDGRKH